MFTAHLSVTKVIVFQQDTLAMCASGSFSVLQGKPSGGVLYGQRRVCSHCTNVPDLYFIKSLDLVNAHPFLPKRLWQKACDVSCNRYHFRRSNLEVIIVFEASSDVSDDERSSNHFDRDELRYAVPISPERASQISLCAEPQNEGKHLVMLYHGLGISP